MNKRLEPTSVKPPAHVNTGPIVLKILLVHVLETKKLMQARDVNSNPMSFVTIPWFLRKVEKKLVWESGAHRRKLGEITEPSIKKLKL